MPGQIGAAGEERAVDGADGRADDHPGPKSLLDEGVHHPHLECPEVAAPAQHECGRPWCGGSPRLCLQSAAVAARREPAVTTLLLKAMSHQWALPPRRVKPGNDG